MREMIPIPESFTTDGWSTEKASLALTDLSAGMALLVKDKWVPASLRLQHGFDQIKMTPDQSLLDCLLRMQKSGATRDSALFWMRLAQKLPLQKDLTESVKDRFLRSEPAAPVKSDALVLCAHLAGIAISLPTAPIWQANQFTVIFNELLADEIVESDELIDNMACCQHASELVSRWQALALKHLTPENFWQQRSIAFPALIFGQDVQSHLASQGGHAFETILQKLADLNSSAADWKNAGGAAPNWKTRVSPESVERMKNDKFVDSRRFKNADGLTCLYEWHARFGASGRIHIRFDASTKTVEVGYIGTHLPQ